MRRTFIGGISLGLGLFANTAAAQDAKYPPLRVAKLGAPSALPDASPPVTPRRDPRRGSDPRRAALAGLRHSRIKRTGARRAGHRPAFGRGHLRHAGLWLVNPGYGGHRCAAADRPASQADAGRRAHRDRVAKRRGRADNRRAGHRDGGSPIGPSGGTYAVPRGWKRRSTTMRREWTRSGRIGGCSRWYVGGEYLLWWTRGSTLPPLITTSSPQFFGIPGLGDTRTVVGGDSFGDTLHDGRPAYPGPVVRRR